MAPQNTRGGKAHPKKKRSFLIKARKYARKGLFGRGKNVDEETYNYFVRVMERLREEFEDDEEKEIFVTNVFEQTKDKEMDLMCNQVVSKVLEKLIPLAKPEIFQHFASVMQKEMRIICTDPYASHVLETMMKQCMEVLSAKVETDKDHENFCFKWLSLTCQYAFNNVEDFISDIYASHILRTAVHLLSGVDVDVNLMKSNRSRKHIDKDEPEGTPKYKSPEYETMLVDFVERFTAWPQIHDLVHTEDSSAVIQTILLCTNQVAPDASKKLVQLLTGNILPSISREDIFASQPLVHILEACLLVGDSEIFRQLHEKYFKGNLKSLAEDPNCKFAVIKLLDAVKDKELFAEIFEELAPGMEDIFAAGCGGVISSLTSTCRRLSTLQAKCLQHLMQTFHCFDPESRQTKIVPLVARLVTFEVAEERRPDEKTNVHFIGSQIVQSLLHFGKPIKVVTSLLEMDTGDLKDLMCDPVGSHIVDAFVDAEFVGEKSREKMFHKLAGSYFALATSKHGSRALDALWKVANIKMRMTIGEELLQKEAALSSNMFGRIIMDRYALPLLKKQKGDWKDQQEKEGKKKRLFADIIEPLEADDKIKKKKKKKA